MTEHQDGRPQLRHESRRRIQALLDGKISERHREIVLLYLTGCQQAEIASKCATSVRAIKSQIRELLEFVQLRSLGEVARWVAYESFVRAGAPVAAPPVMESALTPREREVVSCALEGKTNREIRMALRISPNTLKTHIRNLLHKVRMPSLDVLAASWRDPSS